MADGEQRFDGAEQMRILLHSLPVLVTTRTRQGTYTGVFSDHQVLDYPSSRDLIGKQTEDVLNPPAANAIMDGVRRALDTGEHQRIEFPLIIGGERFWRIGRLAPYGLAGDSEPEEAIMVSFDASEQNAREQALYDALEVLGTHTARAANDTIALRVGDVPVRNETLSVPATGTRTVTLTHTFDDPGEYALAVGTGSVGPITVEPVGTAGTADGPGGVTDTTDGESSTSPASSSNERTTGGSGPGFDLAIALVALVALVALALVVRRRR